VNDNPPEFDPPFYTIQLSENATVGSEITRVHARDPDSAETTQLTYSIRDSESHSQFEIDVLDGRVLLVEALDFEEEQVHIFIVQADDQIHVPATASVILTVTNVNDNAPDFAMTHYTTSVTENTPGRELFDFSVHDRDIDSDPNTISFRIESGNTDEIFAIDTTSGSLTVKDYFDFEVLSTSEYLLIITASDNEDPPLAGTAYVTVMAQDTNDNAPVGEDQVFNVFLYNGQLALQTLGKLLIRDPDTVNDYVLEVSGDESVFSIELGDTIDIVQYPPPPGVYSFTVNVTDGNFEPVITRVDITVVNITDAHLANSFTMQVDSNSVLSFLDNHLQHFLSTIEDLLTDKASIRNPKAYVFNITSSKERRTNIDLSIVVQSGDGDIIHPNLVQHILHVNRDDIEENLGLTIVTEYVDHCADESLCPLGTVCTIAREYSSSRTVLGSAAASLLGIDRVEHQSCSKVSFECSISCPEPSYCAKQGGHDVCIDNCTPNPCKNNGKCQDQMPGYYCSCPSGFDGRNCELTTSYFQEDSYAVLPAVATLTNGTIALEFTAAEGAEGLLYYSSRFDDSKRDFLALEVISGHLSLVASYGAETMRVSVRLDGGDGWYTAVVEYSSSDITLTVKTFDPYTVQGMSRRLSSPNSYSSLNLGGPFIVGHLPEIFNYIYDGASYSNLHFCVRELVINGRLQDFSNALETVELSPSCELTCSSDICKNGGRCIGSQSSFTCVCPVEYAGTTCSENSQSATFSGDSVIRYEILNPTSERRGIRQTQVHTTGRDYVTLAFITSSEFGTILLLGIDDEDNEYATLEVDGGYLQFRFNLGSGEATARQTTIQVNDGVSHVVTVERKERTVTLVIDGSYVARATSPPESNTLDIQSDRVFLGANVDTNGRSSKGFSGCVTGAKLNHRDLPVSGSTKDFVADPSTGVETGCTFVPPQTEGAFPTVVTFAAGGGVLFLIVLVIPIGIVVCVIGRYSYRKRKTYNPRNRQATSRSPTFNWQSAPERVSTEGSRPRQIVSQTSQFSETDSFALPTLSQNNNEGSLFAPSTPVASEHVFRTADQTPEQPTRREHHNVSESHQQPSPQSNHHVRRLRTLEQQQHLQQQEQQTEQQRQQTEEHHRPSQQSSPLQRTAIAVQPPSIPKPHVQTQLSTDSTPAVVSDPHAPPSAPTHYRSPSGHQSIMTIMTTATMRSEATSIFDDSEMGRYVLKRIEAANEELKSLHRDEMIQFKEEGEFEPLGSIGSLYDILREADEDYEPLEHTSAPASRPPTKPKPSLPNTHLSQPPASSSNRSTANHIVGVKGRPPSEHPNPDQEDKPSLNHAKSNGTPPQAAEIVTKAKGRRRGKRAAPALKQEESIMDKFQNISTTHPNSQEWDASRLV
jgi:hypothetical protein